MENDFICKKIFDWNGDLKIRFNSNAKEQIETWIRESLDYNENENVDFAYSFGIEIDCPVFGKALEYPCKIIDNIN